MSSILLFNEKTSNINNGTDVIVRIVDGSKLEDIPRSAFPYANPKFTYSTFVVESERRIDDLKQARYLTVNNTTFKIWYIREVTHNEQHPKYDILTIKEN